MPKAIRSALLWREIGRPVALLVGIMTLLAVDIEEWARAAEAEDGQQTVARTILDATGVRGGLIVHVGCGDGRLTAGLRGGQGCLVQGLDVDAENVSRTRQRIRSLGPYGPVAADTFDGEHLPYIDNVVKLLVVSRPEQVSVNEMQRVLAPGGVAYVRGQGGWKKTVKSWPKEIDEWTHYLHGPDNNAVAHDTVVGPPRRMQWLADPRWTRTHHKLNSISSVVTAGGRIFYILDQGPAANSSLPGKWAILARDAFSGVRLWEKPMTSWASNTIRFRSGPSQITRLLVVSGDRLYAPLGLSSPVSAIDAATGKTLTTYGATAGAEEILVVGQTLLALKGAPVAEQAAGHPAFAGEMKGPNQKAIVAVDTETGEELWSWSDARANPLPETLAAAGRRVYFQVNQSVTSLDLKSGQELWTFGQRGQRRSKRISFGRYTLVVADSVVLCKLAGNLTAISADDGQKLWECKAGDGFHAPLDVFVIDGQVWQGLHVSDSVAPAPIYDFSECRDLRTGEVSHRNQILVDLQTAGHHHRCYREKATDRFILAGKRGIEMMDLMGEGHSRNNWVRGTCQYGILPANGLVYAPSHSCGCYMESKLWGFWALAPGGSATAPWPQKVSDADRLQRGPAYGEPAKAVPATAESWPQYRHDPLRSGVAGTVVPARLEQAWKTTIGGRLTQPVIAGDKVVLAAVDENTVYALDEQTGRVLWTYTAGGRVDSPPAIHQGRVLFGSADGWVYCVRLDDGQLVWRFLAAPHDVRTVSLDQVESVWPVHGSVLVLGGVAYCAAGRCSWLDGGIDLYALEPATGEVVCKTGLESRHPEYQENQQGAQREHVTRVDQNTTDYKTFLASDLSDSFSMAGGCVTDVLVSDGKNVFLHHLKFDAELRRQKMSRHLFSTSCLLDGAENHRSHWVMGTGDFSRIPVAYSWIVNGNRKSMPTIAVPTGLMMVYEDHALWGVQQKYQLVEKENRPFSEEEPFLPDFRTIPVEDINKSRWRAKLPLRPRAMLKSGDHLVLGGTPLAGPQDDPYAPYEGRAGGKLVFASISDGSLVTNRELESPVVWDGMAAAGGKLFLSTVDGSLRCFAGR